MRKWTRFATRRYQIGQVVRHRLYPFRGVVFDIDPIFANTEEWYQAIPAEVAAAQGPAVLSSVRRERRDRIRGLCLGAEPVAGRERRAGAPSASRRSLHQRRQRRLSSARRTAALKPRVTRRLELFQKRSSRPIGAGTPQVSARRPSRGRRAGIAYGFPEACGDGAAGVFEDCGWPCWLSSFLRASSARRCNSSCSFFCCSSNTFGSVGGPS